MAFKYQVYKSQRVCLVRFIRHTDGEPAVGFPDLDNRGSFRAHANATGFDRGPVVSVMQGDKIRIKVLRERIDPKAPLFATSSDKSVMTVGNKNQLPDSYAISLKLTGIKGSGTAIPKGAKLRIHYGSPTGVVIGEISVWVFTKLSVNMTPHRVDIFDAAGAHQASNIDIDKVIAMTRAFWRPYGIVFNVAPVINLPMICATAGQVVWSEFNGLLGPWNIPLSINAYFVFQTEPGVFGYGYSRTYVNDPANGITFPGIILADANGIRDRHNDIHHLANDLAHEIGHFFGLSHVDQRDSDNPRDDTWSNRMLMFPQNNLLPKGNWQDDIGYGINAANNNRGYRGGLVTMKDLIDSNNTGTNHITDPEYFKARQTILSSAGPY